MKYFPVLLLFFLFFFAPAHAQTVTDTISPVIADTTIVPDTIIRNDQPIIPRSDSISKRPRVDNSWQLDPGKKMNADEMKWEVMLHHPWLGFASIPFTHHSHIKQFQGKEPLFYVVVAILLIYALLRNAFPKYFNDLFRLFFRTTLKQRQIREQLMQTPLPSLLMNGFFILSAGLYIAFILRHYHIDPVGNFWLMAFYVSIGLSVAYFVKFLGLKFSGWLFNMKEAANAYVFIVFVVNKMIGILLLPFIILLAFSVGSIYTVSLNLSFCLIAGLLAYRFILTFAAVRNQVKVNPFHFFLYLCAFEIAPLLLVYKGLLVYFRQTA